MPTPSSPSDPSPGDQYEHLLGRLQRLEEHVAFSEHDADQLKNLVLDLGKRLDALARRIESLERRETEAREKGASDDAEASAEK